MKKVEWCIRCFCRFWFAFRLGNGIAKLPLELPQTGHVDQSLVSGNVLPVILFQRHLVVVLDMFAKRPAGVIDLCLAETTGVHDFLGDFPSGRGFVGRGMYLDARFRVGGKGAHAALVAALVLP